MATKRRKNGEGTWGTKKSKALNINSTVILVVNIFMVKLTKKSNRRFKINPLQK